MTTPILAEGCSRAAKTSKHLEFLNLDHENPRKSRARARKSTSSQSPALCIDHPDLQRIVRACCRIGNMPIQKRHCHTLGSVPNRRLNLISASVLVRVCSCGFAPASVLGPVASRCPRIGQCPKSIGFWLYQDCYKGY